jgi:hypothetical protein
MSTMKGLFMSEALAGGHVALQQQCRAIVIKSRLTYSKFRGTT